MKPRYRGPSWVRFFRKWKTDGFLLALSFVIYLQVVGISCFFPSYFLAQIQGGHTEKKFSVFLRRSVGAFTISLVTMFASVSLSLFAALKEDCIVAFIGISSDDYCGVYTIDSLELCAVLSGSTLAYRRFRL